MIFARADFVNVHGIDWLRRLVKPKVKVGVLASLAFKSEYLPGLNALESPRTTSVASRDFCRERSPRRTGRAPPFLLHLRGQPELLSFVLSQPMLLSGRHLLRVAAYRVTSQPSAYCKVH